MLSADFKPNSCGIARFLCDSTAAFLCYMIAAVRCGIARLPAVHAMRASCFGFRPSPYLVTLRLCNVLIFAFLCLYTEIIEFRLDSKIVIIDIDDVWKTHSQLESTIENETERNQSFQTENGN